MDFSDVKPHAHVYLALSRLAWPELIYYMKYYDISSLHRSKQSD